MEVVIHQSDLDKLSLAPVGCYVIGTFNSHCGVASISGVLPDLSVLDRPVLGRLDQLEPGALLSFSRLNGKLTVSLPDGQPCAVTAYGAADYLKRTPLEPCLVAHLAAQVLLMIGTGSMGGELTVQLAKSGVGTIIGADPDVLKIHNCMRHPLGAPYLLWPKPVALERHLHECAPGTRFIPVELDLFGEGRTSLRAIMEKSKPSLVLALTDSLEIQYCCQMLAVVYGLPFAAIWADSNAVEGELFLWEPGRPELACYECLRPTWLPTPERGVFDYSSDEPGRYGGEPALGTMITHITTCCSILLTGWLLRGAANEHDSRLDTALEPFAEGAQYVRFGGPYLLPERPSIQAKQPWEVSWRRVRRDPACGICGENPDPATRLFSVAARASGGWDDPQPTDPVKGDAMPCPPDS